MEEVEDVDARQRRSQEALYAAVLELATATPVSDLSVTEVARSAGVHRSTFYDHAAGPADLLRAALLAELDALRADLLDDPGRDTAEAVADTTARVLGHVRDHVAIYRRGLAADSRTGLAGLLGEHFLQSSRRLVEQGRLTLSVEGAGARREEVVDAATRFVAQGTVGVIQAWVAGPDPLDVSAGTAMYDRLVPSWWVSFTHPASETDEGSALPPAGRAGPTLRPPDAGPDPS